MVKGILQMGERGSLVSHRRHRESCSIMIRMAAFVGWGKNQLWLQRLHNCAHPVDHVRQMKIGFLIWESEADTTILRNPNQRQRFPQFLASRAGVLPAR